MTCERLKWGCLESQVENGVRERFASHMERRGKAKWVAFKRLKRP
jgi:hypothetical protein